MTRRNGRPKRIHQNRLHPSAADEIALAQAVGERFINLCGAFLRIRGTQLAPPADLDADMLRWRTMCVRHRKGDFRNSRAELLSTRAVAEWTLAVNAELRNQPKPVVEWRD